jgi:hypothetical protein
VDCEELAMGKIVLKTRLSIAKGLVLLLISYLLLSEVKVKVEY